MRPTLLILTLALLAGTAEAAREKLEIPAVSVELSFGGEGKLTVDGKVTKLTGEQVAKLRADLAALRVDVMRQDLTRLQGLEAAAAKATSEGVLRGRAVERETDRVADQQRQIASLEKRQKEAQEELADATQRGHNVNLDNLRSKLNAITSSLASERKELERARERLALAEKRKAENAAAVSGATSEAAGLRKDLTERVGKLKAVLESKK